LNVTIDAVPQVDGSVGLEDCAQRWGLKMDLIRLDSSLTPENEYPDDHWQVADRVEKIESHFPEHAYGLPPPETL